MASAEPSNAWAGQKAGVEDCLLTAAPKRQLVQNVPRPKARGRRASCLHPVCISRCRAREDVHLLGRGHVTCPASVALANLPTRLAF